PVRQATETFSGQGIDTATERHAAHLAENGTAGHTRAPGDDVVAGIEPGFQTITRHRAVEAVLRVLGAGPQQFDGGTLRQPRGNQGGLLAVVTRASASTKTTTGLHAMDGDKL